MENVIYSSKRNNSTRMRVERLLDVPYQPTLAYYPHGFKSIQHPIVFEIMNNLVNT